MDKKEIKEYWEKYPAGVWYSNKQEGSKVFFDEIENYRFNQQYRYLPQLMEFNRHRNENVLEVGCGIGSDLIRFARNGANVTGIDLTERAITLARKRFSIYNLQAKLMIEDAENLPFRDESFDLVYSFGVLHHTPNIQKAIDEIYRVLKKGKKAIIMLYHKSYDYYFHLFLKYGILKGELLRMNMQQIANKHTEHVGNSPLTAMFSKRQAKQLFTNFSKIELYVRFLHKAGLLYRITTPWILDKLSRFIGYHLIIKARK